MKNSIIYVIVFLGIQAAASIIVTGCWKLITGNGDITTTNLIVTSAPYLQQSHNIGFL